MQKYLLLILFVVVSAVAVNAQYDPHYTQFMHNKLVINPGYAGSKEVLTFTALYRNQWSGIDGAPKTYNFAAHSAFFDNRCGGGLTVVGDQHGLYRSTNVGLNYAYRLKLSNTATMSIGLSGSMEIGNVDFTQIDPYHLEDGDIPMNDNTRINPNFGVGFYYSHPNYYVGVSAPNMLRTIVFSEDPDKKPDINRMRSYYVMAGFMTRLSPAVQFKPAMLLTLNPSTPFELDMNASFLLMEKVWLGASYRLGDSIDALFQYQFNPQIRLGVAVDMTTSELRQYSAGSFEVMIEYGLNYEGKSLNHLRYF